MGWSWTERVPCKQGESKQGSQPRQDGFQIKEDRSFFQASFKHSPNVNTWLRYFFPALNIDQADFMILLLLYFGASIVLLFYFDDANV